MAPYDARFRVNGAAYQQGPPTWCGQHARIPAQRERRRHAARHFAVHFSGLAYSVRRGRPSPRHGRATKTALTPGLRLLAERLDHFSFAGRRRQYRCAVSLLRAFD